MKTEYALPLHSASLIREMALCERPKNRLFAQGPEALSDDELLSIVLRLDSLEKARALLDGRSLTDFISQPHLKFRRKLGVSGAAIIGAMNEIGKRTSGKDISNAWPVLASVNDVVAQAVELREKKKEYLLAFFVNARHQLIAKEVISIGTLTASLAHPREIFYPAIGKACAGVILAHNHPSGDPTPSEEDVRLTKRIGQAGHILGIELLDHLIVAENGVYSFKTAGQL